MFRARQTFARIKLAPPSKQFCNSSTKLNNSNKSVSEKTGSNVSKSDDVYWQLDNLDFMKAAKIVFTDPPKKKKFGLDFHLVQLFFTCLPSLAVYLVAQYARHEMKKMDAELEKKKKEEEEKAKEEELKAIEEKAQSESELLEVKEKLGKLEEVVKEIAVESRKRSGGSVKKTQVQEDSNEALKPASTEASNRISESSKSVGKDHLSIQKSLEPAPVPDSSQKGKIQNEGNSPDAKR
ncbi:PREDICTED: stress response protein NST1-like [Populus euphratica]|uniref:Stress response protein NST1-like n=1 Tax=Populus euphratica TaxID=75702 RepID=A0AAJ6XX53_POPEU|nr:PREDICTED: stress response protein NST1-like [Populus euphratica]